MYKPIDLDRGWSIRMMAVPLFFLCLVLPGGAALAAVSAPASASTTPTEHVILFVLEGFGQDSLKGGRMPTLSRLIKEGAVTWSATAVKPALRLPTMASLITGLPVEKHGITWNTFEFSRGYPRAPSVFDYLDLSGGRDSAIFFMDESLYQLARPEPYTDYQMCGPLKPECSTDRIVSYMRCRIFWSCIFLSPVELVRHEAGPRKSTETPFARWIRPYTPCWASIKNRG